MWISSLEKVKKLKRKNFFWGIIVNNLRHVQSAHQNLCYMYREIWWALMSTRSAEHISDVRLLIRYSNVYPISHSTVLRKLCGTHWRSLRMHTFPSLYRDCLTRLIWPSVREIPQPHRKWKQLLKPLPGNLICDFVQLFLA